MVEYMYWIYGGFTDLCGVGDHCVERESRDLVITQTGEQSTSRAIFLEILLAHSLREYGMCGIPWRWIIGCASPSILRFR
jgi:hypothetical protein